MQNLILVDKNNHQIGTLEKLKAHLGKGSLHRAFTCILTNDKKEILFTRRSLKKPLWPIFWDLSFSSHPWDGEDLVTAVIRRASQELGIKIKNPKLLFSYYYQTEWSQIFSEHEINHIFLADFNGKLKLNPEEISDKKWISLGKLKKLDKKTKIAPWITLVKKDILKKLK